MNKRNQFWGNFADNLHPIPRCPLNMSSIKIVNAIADLGFAARLPLDGYTWITSFKLYKPIAHVRYKKQCLLCLISEATITKPRRQQR